VGGFLLSIASPELIGWTGFVILGAALVGEAALGIIPTKWEAVHKELAFIFAVLAAGGYALERLGDDAVVTALEHRATTAEGELSRIQTPRKIDDQQYVTLVECLRAGPKGTTFVWPGLSDRDAAELGQRIQSALDEAGLALGCLSLLMVSYTLGSWALGHVVEGWTSLLTVVLVLGSTQLILFGLLGEYVSRLYSETQHRPLFVIDQVVTQNALASEEYSAGSEVRTLAGEV
jgi:hypothetical protein